MYQKYTIKSTSEEGTYYLVNGWNKHKTFWTGDKTRKDLFFNKPAQAKASLTKLLSVMPEYSSDKFELVEIE